MIGKVVKGANTGGVIRYLYSKGRSNEHLNPRVVADWDDIQQMEPALTASGQRDFRPMLAGLNLPLANGRHPEQFVWHYPLRAAPGDRILTDSEWADVAREVMHQTGYSRRDDDDGCRWVAIRHADDHIHLVVTLARQDGFRVNRDNDYHKAMQACRIAEQRYGLQVVPSGDGQVARETQRPEIEKSARVRLSAPAPDLLRSQIEQAAKGSDTTFGFVRRLQAGECLVKLRFSKIDPEQITGYSVALKGFNTAQGEPVWYSGGKLRANLSLPRLQEKNNWVANDKLELERQKERKQLVAEARAGSMEAQRKLGPNYQIWTMQETLAMAEAAEAKLSPEERNRPHRPYKPPPTQGPRRGR